MSRSKRSQRSQQRSNMSRSKRSQISAAWQYILYEVQGTLTCAPTPRHNRDIKKRAFYGNGFRSAGTNMQRPFFLQTYLFLLRAVRTASESTKKMRPKYGNIRPVWTRPNQKDFLNKNAPFFTSVRPSVKTASAAGTTRSGRVDVLKPPVYSA